MDARIEDSVSRPGAHFESGQARVGVRCAMAASCAESAPALQESPSTWKQTLVLTQRAFTNNWRDLGIFWMRVAMCAHHAVHASGHHAG